MSGGGSDFPVPGDAVRTPVEDADRAAESRPFVRRQEEASGSGPGVSLSVGMGEIAGRRPARQGSSPEGPRRLGGSVGAANRARRREAADGKKLEEKRGHSVERHNIGSVMLVAGEAQLGVWSAKGVRVARNGEGCES